VTLEGIDNVDDFVEKLDRIEPPGQMVSLLIDPLLQKYVELKPSLVTATRVDLWLATCLEDLYEAKLAGASNDRYMKDVLEGLLKHAQCTRVRFVSPGKSMELIFTGLASHGSTVLAVLPANLGWTRE
jgi:centromere protein I